MKSLVVVVGGDRENNDSFDMQPVVKLAKMA